MQCLFCVERHEIGPEFYATLSHIKILESPPNRPISECDINNMVIRERESPGFFSSLPPIHLMFGFGGNNELWLLDGQDRYVAAGDLGRENIRAITHPWMDEASIERFRFRANDIGRGNDREMRILHGVFLVRNCKMSLRDAAHEARLNDDEGKGGGEVTIHRMIKKLESEEKGTNNKKKPLTPEKAAYDLLVPVYRFANLSVSDNTDDPPLQALADHLCNNPDFIPAFEQAITMFECAVEMARE